MYGNSASIPLIDICYLFLIMLYCIILHLLAVINNVYVLIYQPRRKLLLIVKLDIMTEGTNKFCMQNAPCCPPCSDVQSIIVDVE